MKFDIIREVTPKKTFRVESIIGKFDLQTNHIKEHFIGSIELPKKWQIGLIIGKSGSGKTTIAKELFSKEYITNFKYKAESILDDMPENKSIDEICRTFNSVGFSSPPSWLKPYSVLSNGEKMRVDLSRAILEKNNLFVFDEFTSVVDRQIAKIGSFAIQKAIRRTEKQFIAVTCHYDVEDWLLPDWIFNTDTMTFQLSQKKNRPELNFKIFAVETKDKNYYWKMFSKFHYLSANHNNSARVFIATLNDEICGFISVLHLPARVKNIKQGHRLVIFPDYQGISLSNIFLNEVAKIISNDGNRFVFTTSNPAMINYLKKSDMWRCTFVGRKCSNGNLKSLNKTLSINRITTSWEYKSL